MEQINKADAALYVDIVCHCCHRNVALANTHEVDGNRYCNRCWNAGLDYFEEKLNQNQYEQKNQTR